MSTIANLQIRSIDLSIPADGNQDAELRSFVLSLLNVVVEQSEKIHALEDKVGQINAVLSHPGQHK